MSIKSSGFEWVVTRPGRVVCAMLVAGLVVGVLTLCGLPWRWNAISYVVICAGLSLVAMMCVDAGLIRERMRPGAGAVDHVTVWVEVVLCGAHLVIAGLDRRFGWSLPLPDGVIALGLVAFAQGGALLVWCMCVNPFFSSVVRHQAERGHQLIESGPYAIVRHPGYSAMILLFCASGLALGSWMSALPLAVMIVFILRRTVIEDRFLVAELGGYGDYVRRVRFRLMPRVW